MTLKAGDTVVVTGAGGYLASELIAQLLSAGVTVRGTVRSLSDPTRTAHLFALPGASTLLTLFEAELTGPTTQQSFEKAFAGATHVFHTACPFKTVPTALPLGEAFFVTPAVEGTLAVLRAVEATPSVRRVVMTSSSAAIFKRLHTGSPYSEAVWNDVVELAERKLWYSIAKTKQEKAAWAWMQEAQSRGVGFDLVCVNPSMIEGEARQPTLNASIEVVKELCDGSKKLIPNVGFPWVHVEDAAEAHIRAAEHPGVWPTESRFLMIASWPHMKVVCDTIRSAFPQLADKIPTEVDR